MPFASSLSIEMDGQVIGDGRRSSSGHTKKTVFVGMAYYHYSKFSIF
jgi:hypothetical protein